MHIIVARSVNRCENQIDVNNFNFKHYEISNFNAKSSKFSLLTTVPITANFFLFFTLTSIIIISYSACSRFTLISLCSGAFVCEIGYETSL